MLKLINAVKRFLRRPFERHKDLELRCADCGAAFRFEWGEQQFYKSRGLTPPRRCPDCRSSRPRPRRHGGGRRR